MENLSKNSKTTLKGYADSLRRTSPWVDFSKEVRRRTGVTEPTLVGWINGRKPHKFEHVLALSEITGIRPEDLWK